MDTGKISFDVFDKSNITNDGSIIRNDNDGFDPGAGGNSIEDKKEEEPIIYSQSVWFPSFSSQGVFQGDDPFTKSCVESTESPTKVTEFDERNSPGLVVSSHIHDSNIYFNPFHDPSVVSSHNTPDNNIDFNPFRDPSVVSSHISDPPVISSRIIDNNIDFNPFLDPSEVSSHIHDNNIDFNPFHDPYKLEHQRGLDNDLPSPNDELKGEILFPESKKDTSSKIRLNTGNVNPEEETEAWCDPDKHQQSYRKRS
jgi:hypothetical protein